MTRRIAALVAALVMPCLANAEAGVTANEIIIGQDIDLSGAIAVRMKPLMQAADAYIERVNKQGGVNGRQIRIIRADSANKPDKTKENVKKLVEKDGVFAMWGISGTGNTAAALPYLEEQKVPLVGSTSGADSFYDKTHPMLFNVKAGYGDEIRLMASHLKSTYVDRVAILYMDNGFGKETYKTAMAAAEQNNLKVLVSASFKEDGSDIAQAVAKISEKSPPAIFMLSLSGPAPKVVDAFARTGKKSQMFALSIVAPESLYKASGDSARGIVVTQIVPFPTDRTTPMVRDYQNLVAAKGVKDYSHAGVEGYLLARALVEGLQGAGRNPTRESLLRSFESMHGKDIGGMTLDFAPNQHNGARFAEITMIGRNGKLVR
jgi:ABC-type branched-subunit amino acid transport system substrate-binding protein